MNCDITGAHIQSGEKIQVAGNSTRWVSSSSMALLLMGLSAKEIAKRYRDLKEKMATMSEADRKEFFADCATKIE